MLDAGAMMPIADATMRVYGRSNARLPRKQPAPEAPPRRADAHGGAARRCRLSANVLNTLSDVDAPVTRVFFMPLLRYAAAACFFIRSL